MTESQEPLEFRAIILNSLAGVTLYRHCHCYHCG